MPASVLVCTPVPLEFHAGLPAPAPGWRRRRAHRYWRVAPLAPARPAVDRYKAATSTGATHLLITQVTRRPQSGWRANRKGRRAAVARHSRGRRRRPRPAIRRVCSPLGGDSGTLIPLTRLFYETTGATYYRPTVAVRPGINCYP